MINFYSAVRPILFKLDSEDAHEKTLNFLRKFSFLIPRVLVDEPVQLMGILFPNRLGLAAGLDKNGIAIEAFDRMGFGFIEVGTVTPKPQPGNPKPRLFRLPEEEAIINRMGFNNLGVDALVSEVASVKAGVRATIGINLGKNKDTPNEAALSDYQLGMETAYRYADYLTINISSPNTVGLRDLQHVAFLRELLDGLKKTQLRCQQRFGRYVPLVLKIAPDNNNHQLIELCKVVAEFDIDGIIATNTTTARRMIAKHPLSKEEGGLSGAPLSKRSTEVVQLVREQLPQITLIASGGVMSAEDYLAKRAAGADLVQLYTGLVYYGTALVKECLAQK